jgi:hypothetical protein
MSLTTATVTIVASAPTYTAQDITMATPAVSSLISTYFQTVVSSYTSALVLPKTSVITATTAVPVALDTKTVTLFKTAAPPSSMKPTQVGPMITTTVYISDKPHSSKTNTKTMHNSTTTASNTKMPFGATLTVTVPGYTTAVATPAYITTATAPRNATAFGNPVITTIPVVTTITTNMAVTTLPAPAPVYSNTTDCGTSMTPQTITRTLSILSAIVPGRTWTTISTGQVPTTRVATITSTTMTPTVEISTVTSSGERPITTTITSTSPGSTIITTDPPQSYIPSVVSDVTQPIVTVIGPVVTNDLVSPVTTIIGPVTSAVTNVINPAIIPTVKDITQVHHITTLLPGSDRTTKFKLTNVLERTSWLRAETATTTVDADHANPTLLSTEHIAGTDLDVTSTDADMPMTTNMAGDVSTITEMGNMPTATDGLAPTTVETQTALGEARGAVGAGIAAGVVGFAAFLL